MDDHNVEQADDPRVIRSRAAVMDAAIALFVDGGINGVTIEAVAARAAVAKTTIYRHWPSRQHLLMDVFRHFDHRFDPPSSTDPPVEQLKDLSRQLAVTLTSREWQRALPALLDVTRRIDEFAGEHGMGIPGAGSMSRAIAVLIERDILPRDTPVGEVLVQIVGPLTLGAIFAPEQIADDFVDRLVERLILGYASERDVPS